MMMMMMLNAYNSYINNIYSHFCGIESDMHEQTRPINIRYKNYTIKTATAAATDNHTTEIFVDIEEAKN